MLALVAEGFLVERLEDDIDLFLEQFAVGFLVHQWGAEGFDFPRVVTAGDAEHDAAMRQDVGHGVVLGQAQRVPHRRYVEAAADIDVLCHVRQVQRHQQHVGDALGALTLEMMFRHPEGRIAQAVHFLRDRLRLPQGGGQMGVVVPPFVDRDTTVADVLHVGVAGKQAVEFGDHGPRPLMVAAIVPAHPQADKRSGRV